MNHSVKRTDKALPETKLHNQQYTASTARREKAASSLVGSQAKAGIGFLLW